LQKYHHGRPLSFILKEGIKPADILVQFMKENVSFHKEDKYLIHPVNGIQYAIPLKAN
jgi:hypothetical protein